MRLSAQVASALVSVSILTSFSLYPKISSLLALGGTTFTALCIYCIRHYGNRGHRYTKSNSRLRPVEDYVTELNDMLDELLYLNHHIVREKSSPIFTPHRDQVESRIGSPLAPEINDKGPLAQNSSGFIQRVQLAKYH